MLVRVVVTQVFFCAAVVLPVSLVSAADQFYREDSNKDGVLSGREARDLLALDADSNQEISSDEFTAAARKQRAHAVSYAGLIFSSRDENRDQRLSGSEMSGVEHFDRNGDRRLSKLEFKTCLVNGDPSIQDISGAKIREIAIDRVRKMDTNEDGRVTGTEGEIVAHFDRDQDGQLTREEYIAGLLLCAEVADALSPGELVANTPVTNEEVHRAYTMFVTVLHDVEKVDLIHDWLHDDLRFQVDPLILDYALQLAKKSHGNMGLPPLNEIRISTADGGDIQAEADLRCKKGGMKLVLRFKDGRINGFQMDSPEMQSLEKALYRDLQKEELQEKFSSSYGVDASFMLTRILDNEDVFFSLHPPVVERVGRATFEKLFERFRSNVGQLQSQKVESFGTDMDENGVFSFTVTHIVTGTGVPQRYATTYQLSGMDAVITGLEVADAPDHVPASAPAPQSMGPSVAQLSAAWIETAALKEGLAFKAPAQPTRTEQDSPGGHLTRFVLDQPEKKMKFQVDLIRLKVDVSTEAATFFEAAKATFLETTRGTLLQEEIENEKGPFPSQMLAVRLEDKRIVVVHSILDGSNYYSFVWSGLESPEHKPSMIAFHESVKLIAADGSLRPGFQQKDVDGEPNTEDESTESPAPP